MTSLLEFINSGFSNLLKTANRKQLHTSNKGISSVIMGSKRRSGPYLIDVFSSFVLLSRGPWISKSCRPRTDSPLETNFPKTIYKNRGLWFFNNCFSLSEPKLPTQSQKIILTMWTYCPLGSYKCSRVSWGGQGRTWSTKEKYFPSQFLSNWKSQKIFISLKRQATTLQMFCWGFFYSKGLQFTDS